MVSIQGREVSLQGREVSLQGRDVSMAGRVSSFKGRVVPIEDREASVTGSTEGEVFSWGSQEVGGAGSSLGRETRGMVLEAGVMVGGGVDMVVGAEEGKPFKVRVLSMTPRAPSITTHQSRKCQSRLAPKLSTTTFTPHLKLWRGWMRQSQPGQLTWRRDWPG